MNLLAFAVVAAGAAQLGGPARLSATMAPNPWMVDQYCCEARTFGGSAPVRCCGLAWCAVTSTGCASG
jgi:hypothetical protein